MEVILGTITALLQLLSGDWRGAWQTISKAGAEIWKAIVNMAKNIWGILGDYLKQSWQNIVEGFNAIFGPLAGIAGSIWNSIVNVVKTVVSGLGAFYQVYGQLL